MSTQRLGLAVAALVLVLDQVTKWLVLEMLDLAARPIVVTPFFNLVLVWNPGVSFGMFGSSAPLAPWILSGVALAVVVGLLIWLWRTPQPLIALGLYWLLLWSRRQPTLQPQPFVAATK